MRVSLSGEEKKETSEIKFCDVAFDEESLKKNFDLNKPNQKTKLKKIVFESCSFIDFSPCMKFLIKNHRVLGIETIQFLKCNPAQEIDAYKNFTHPSLKILTEAEDLNVPTITMETKNKILISIKHGDFIGFTVTSNDMSTYCVPILNLFSMFTSTNNFYHIFGLYLIQKFPQKEENISKEFNRYFLESEQTSFFKDFYNEFQKELKRKSIISYGIWILKDGQKRQVLKDFPTNQTNEFYEYWYLNSLFLNLSAVLLTPHLKCVYTGCDNPYKGNLVTCLRTWLAGGEDGIQSLNIGKKRMGFFMRLHERDIFVWCISLHTVEQIARRRCALDEAWLLPWYTKLGVNYLIFKLKKKGRSHEQAISEAVRMLYQFFFIIKIF